MQSVIACTGKWFTRTITNGIFNYATSPFSSAARSSNLNRDPSNSNQLSPHRNTPCLRLLTAVSGFSKSEGLDRVKPGKFGDDAYFVARNTFGDLIGVADGVGGWRSWGIDPGEFSNCLMQTCENLVTSGDSCSLSPGTLLGRAYEELQNNRDSVVGSSTACVIMVKNKTGPIVNGMRNVTEGLLSSANIGDSGYLLVREGAVVHRSSEQQHYFNTPFQLSVPPPEASGHVLSDSPTSAELCDLKVKAGDLLLIATDGVFDNLPMENILHHLTSLDSSTPSPLSSLQHVANLIAQQARTHAFDESFMSPFALNARENGIDTIGGKPDDITVLLAQIFA